MLISSFKQHIHFLFIPVSLIETSHKVDGSAIIFLHHIVSKLALTDKIFVLYTAVEEILPLTARSILAVGAILTPMGCVKYNGLLSLFCIVVTFVACVPP